MTDSESPPEFNGAGQDGAQTPNGNISLFRRRLLEIVGAVGAGQVFGSTVAAEHTDNHDVSRSSDGTVEKIQQRLIGEFETRRDYSQTTLVRRADASAHDSNDRLSEDAVLTKFGKSLRHEDATGLPTTEAYEALAEACETGEGYESIPQAYDGVDATQDVIDEDPHIDIEPSEFVTGDGNSETLNSKPLVQPETAWTYMTEGKSTAQLRIAQPPAFDDPETGAEMVELYWRALTRDVKFIDYDQSSLVAKAAEELDSLSAYNGPGADGTVHPSNVFRGVTPGCETGPYVSQFLWKDRLLGRGPEDQKIQPQIIDTTATLNNPGRDVGTAGLPRTDYMTTVEDWKKIQKGIVPALDENLDGNQYSSSRRYIINGRDMCERVHDDPPYRQVQKAAQVLIFTMNAPLDDGIPYTLKPFDKPPKDDNTARERFYGNSRNVDTFTQQTTLPFNDFGPLYIEKKVLEASEHGQKAAWHKKWNVHRRLRPEEYGGRVQAMMDHGDVEVEAGFDRHGDDLDAAETYPIPDNLLGSRALELTRRNYGSFLLPQAYAEGSPTHPSYPAGHSVVAGAGVTVLKALFDGDYEFPTDEKVVPTRDGTELVTADELPSENIDADEMRIDETLTVRGELNKLASNMALGRNRAGIHYRTDGIEGLRLGEAAAIQFLEDQLSLLTTVSEQAADGTITLALETFDGEPITIEPTV
jgi:hypothetical protein